MARFIRAANRTLLSSFLFQSRPNSTAKIVRSPVDSNILRIVNTELEYQCELAPPHEAATRFDSFTVEDRPGQVWMTMRRRFNDSEDIKIDAGMFDGFERVTVGGGYDSSEEEQWRLHLSFLVDIRKNEGTGLAVECSAWPDRLEIQYVYALGHGNEMLTRPYLGPNIRKLKNGVHTALREYLEERGVNDKLCAFLHEYALNKGRIEQILWYQKVKSFVEE